MGDGSGWLNINALAPSATELSKLQLTRQTFPPASWLALESKEVILKSLNILAIECRNAGRNSGRGESEFFFLSLFFFASFAIWFAGKPKSEWEFQLEFFFQILCLRFRRRLTDFWLGANIKVTFLWLYFDWGMFYISVLKWVLYLDPQDLEKQDSGLMVLCLVILFSFRLVYQITIPIFWQLTT